MKLINKKDKNILKRRDKEVSKRNRIRIFGGLLNSILTILCLGCSLVALDILPNYKVISDTVNGIILGISGLGLTIAFPKTIVAKNKLDKSIKETNNNFQKEIDAYYEKQLEVESNKVVSDLQPDDFGNCEYGPYEEVLQLLNTKKKILNQQKQSYQDYKIDSKLRLQHIANELSDNESLIENYNGYKRKLTTIPSENNGNN